MTRPRLYLACLILTACAATPALSQPTRADLPVEVTFRNAPGDAVQSDAINLYRDGINNVRAILTGFNEGNLVLDTNDGRRDGGRRVRLSFAGQGGMSDGAADVFMPMRSVNLVGGGDDLRTLLPDASVQKRLNITWTSGKTNYMLRWNGPENGHGFVTVTCTAPAPVNPTGDTCGGWTFTATAEDVAGLYTTASKGGYKEILIATVSMPHEGYITRK